MASRWRRHRSSLQNSDHLRHSSWPMYTSHIHLPRVLCHTASLSLCIVVPSRCFFRMSSSAELNCTKFCGRWHNSRVFAFGTPDHPSCTIVVYDCRGEMGSTVDFMWYDMVLLYHFKHQIGFLASWLMMMMILMWHRQMQIKRLGFFCCHQLVSCRF